MTLQYRKTPYRTHHLQNSKPQKNALPPGQYAGRVLELEQSEKTLKILILLEDQYFWFSTISHYPYVLGELLTFEVDSEDNCIPLESFSSPPSPPSREGDVMRWRRLGKTPRMVFLKQRHQMLQSIRHYFDQQDFLEVNTPVLVKAPSPECQFTTLKTGDDFLITSPEFQMKRMLVGGFEKIYQITSCFRGNEMGPFHNPEFTMLEWYRAFERLETLIHDLEGIVAALAEISPQVHNQCLHTPTSQVQLAAPWQQRSVSELFQHYLQVDLSKAPSAAQLRSLANAQGYQRTLENIPENYEQLFFALWDLFEPHLGQEVPLLVYNWPLPLASLAQTRKDNLIFAERMELYIAGVELANGFGELTDPREQRQRFEKNLQDRQTHQQLSVPLDQAFLDSLTEGMPPSAGMALGVDRLIMLFTGASHIREVLCFAYDER